MSPEPIEGATAALISVGPHQGRTIRSLSDDELNVVLDALTTEQAWGTIIETVSPAVLDKPNREVLQALARAYLQERQRRVQLYKAKAARERARQRRIENTPERRAARAAEKAAAQEREQQRRREWREQAGSQDSYSPDVLARWRQRIDPELANQIFDAGYRVVARKYHPDVGGHHDTMAKLNDTIEGLRSRFPRPHTD